MYYYYYVLQLLLLIPGRLLIFIAHNEVLLPNGQRRTQAGRRVEERLCLFGNVDQRRLEHLLHLHHCCGLQTTISHLPHPRPYHWRRQHAGTQCKIDFINSHRERWHVRLFKHLVWKKLKEWSHLNLPWRASRPLNQFSFSIFLI